jgi:O-antigen biosynthesis protein
MELALNNIPSIDYRLISKPEVRGKFIFLDDEKFYIKGVTYGPFKSDENGCIYKSPEIVNKDFERIALHGFNSIRTYTVPPGWLLDIAYSYGLKVMIGLPVEQNYAFLDDKYGIEEIKESIRESVLKCMTHSSVLAYVIGNEIPAQLVRWHGAKKVEKFLHELCDIVKSLDNTSLVTYVNYPTTEYLNLGFLDFMCFNVYLENNTSFEDYISRLHNIADGIPLVMAEIGLDSMRNGEEQQSQLLSGQVETVFSSGCAGMFIFSWTDEWNKNGNDVTDWQFGLTTKDRAPKKSLVGVSNKLTELPFNKYTVSWPLISVVLCTYNGSKTIAESLEHIKSVEYPNFEVIIVNDGSNDNTVSIIKRYSEKYGFKVISTINKGLSFSRNLGISASRGEIVAFIDDDAYPDTHWLYYIADTLIKNPDIVAVGGPNIVPPEDGTIAQCVASSPGGPAHVLISDKLAEHITGCNMAFRKMIFNKIGEFDEQFITAGDDVDICWRILSAGYKIGFSPSALVWHHRRDSVKRYWKQQYNYGKAEALLLNKWHEKFNILGHINWSGSIYGRGLARTLTSLRSIVYHGTWGTAAFQSLYQRSDNLVTSVFSMPEWYVVIFLSFCLSVIGLFSDVFLIFIPVFLLSIMVPITNSFISAYKCNHLGKITGYCDNRKKMIFITAFLHFTQPISRLLGRIKYGITPFKKIGLKYLSLPFSKTLNIASNNWKSSEHWLRAFNNKLVSYKLPVRTGGAYDRWDFEIIAGLFGKARIAVLVEEHGEGKQYLRFRTFPKFTSFGIITNSSLTISSIACKWYEMEGLVFISLGLLAMTLIRTFYEFSVSIGIIRSSINDLTTEFNNETS